MSGNLKLKLKTTLTLLFGYLFLLQAQSPGCNGYPFGNVDIGVIPTTLNTCAPLEASLYIEAGKVNDGGDPNSVGFKVYWGDGTSTSVFYSSGEITQKSANRYAATVNHIFPAATTTCYYRARTVLLINGTECTSVYIDKDLYVWNTDDRGSGVLTLNEQVSGAVIYRICEGYDANLTFVDNSTFNCNIVASPDVPNQETRWIQFQYGTINNGTYAGTSKIPNVKVGGVQVTDAAGNRTPLNGIVNIIPKIATGSGLTTSVISIDGASTIGKIGSTFEITLRNWNYCNKYTDGAAPRTTTAIIEVIQAPPAPIAADKTVCFGENNALSATATMGGTLRWYSNVGKTGFLGSGNSYKPSVTVSGTYKYYVTETIGTTNCESVPREVTLVIRPQLVLNNITPDPGDNEVCINETNVTFTASTTLIAGTTEYVWTVPGSWTNTASTGNSKTYTIGTVSGTQTVKAVLRYTSAATSGSLCPVSKSINVTVNQLPVASFGADQTICNDSKPSFTINNLSKAGVFRATYKNATSSFNFNNGNTFSSNSTYMHPIAIQTSGAHTFFMDTLVNTVTGCISSFAAPSVTNKADITVREQLLQPEEILGSNPVCANEPNLEYATSSVQFPSWGGIPTRFRWQISSITNGWKFFDNTTSDKLNASDNKMSFTSGTDNGNIQVRLEYTSTPNCQSAARPLAVNVISRAKVSIATNTPNICSGTKPGLIFNISGVSGTGTYEIKYRVGVTEYTINNAVSGNNEIVFSEALISDSVTDFTFTLVSVKNENLPFCEGTISSPDHVVVKVYSNPTGSIASDQTICEGDAAEITSTISGIGPFDVVLKNVSSGEIYNLSSKPSEFKFNVSPIVSSQYQLLSVQMSGNPNCSTIVGNTLNVTVATPPDSAYAGADVALCVLTTHTLNANFPVSGSGTWIVKEKPAGADNPVFSPNADVPDATISITPGHWGIYVLQWQISKTPCNPSTDEVKISFSPELQNPNAGPDDVVCFSPYTLKADSLAGFLTGSWSGTGPGNIVFEDLAKHNSGVLVSKPGTYNFTWSVSNGLCPPKSSTITVQFFENPTDLSAGTNETVCGLSTVLKAKAHEYQAGNGLVSARWWSKISGPGKAIFADSISASSSVTVSDYGVYFLRWIEKNGPCSTSKDVQFTFNKPPQVNPSNTSLCEGATLQIDGNPSEGTSLNHLWQGNIDILSAINIQKPFVKNTTAPGTYNLSYTVTDSNNCSHTAFIAVQIKALPDSPVTSNLSACFQQPIPPLEAAGSNIKWYNEEDSLLFEGNTYNTGKTGIGSYTYYVKQTNECSSMAVKVNLTIYPVPLAPMVIGENACEGKNASLRAITGLSVNWYSDVALSTKVAENISSYYPENLSAGMYIYYATQTVNACESPAGTVSFSIYEKPDAPTVNSFKSCSNEPVPDIVASGDKNAIIVWYSDRELTDVFHYGEKLILGNNPKNHKYYLTQTINGCESDPAVTSINIYNAPEIIITADNDKACTPMSVNFTAVTAFTDSLLWFVDDINLGNDTDKFSTIIHNLTAQVKYSRIKVLASNINGCSKEFVKDLLVYPQADFAFETVPSIMCSPANFQFISKPGGSRYVWDYGDGNIIESTEAITSKNYINNSLVPDTISIKLTATSKDYKCTATFIRDVIVLPGLKADYLLSDDEVCAPAVVQFTNTSVNAVKSSWKFSNGSDMLLSNEKTVYYKYENIDMVRLEYPQLHIMNDYGCEDSIRKAVKVNPQVFSDFTCDTLGCAPFQVSFQNLSKASKFKSTWIFGDGSPDKNDMHVSHTYFNDGSKADTVVAKLIIVSKEWCTDSMSRKIIVYPTLSAYFETDTDKLCMPREAILYNYSKGACKDCYQWNFGDGAISNSSDSLITHKYPDIPKAENYMLTLKIRNSSNLCQDSVSKYISVYPSLKAKIELEDTVCSPFLAKFERVSEGIGSISYEWDFGDGNLSNEATPANKYINSGNETLKRFVKLRLGSEYGCYDMADDSIIIYPSPHANFSITPSQRRFPDAEFSFINGTNSGPWKYEWDFGDGTTSSVSGNTSHTYRHWGKLENKYKIPVNLKIATYLDQCNDIARDTLTLFPPLPLAGFNELNDSCAPHQIVVKSKSKYATGYLWEMGDGTTSTDSIVIHKYDSAGVYTIKLTISGEGGTDTYSDIVVVYPNPVAAFNVLPLKINLPDDVIKCYNLSKKGEKYIWDFGDNNTSDEFSPKHKYTETGEYFISLKVISPYGCVDSATYPEAVIVGNKGLIRYPNAFFPNISGPQGGGAPGFQNPNSVFRPVVESVKEYHFEVYNRWGALIFSTDDINEAWDGYYKGKLCPQDVYVFKAWGKYQDGQTFIQAGDITLLHRKK